VGRFVTEDPVREGGNWFGYAGVSPARATDPSGLMDRPQCMRRCSRDFTAVTFGVATTCAVCFGRCVPACATPVTCAIACGPCAIGCGALMILAWVRFRHCQQDCMDDYPPPVPPAPPSPPYVVHPPAPRGYPTPRDYTGGSPYPLRPQP